MSTHTHPHLPKDKVVGLYRAALAAGVSLESLDQKIHHLGQRHIIMEQAYKVEQDRRWRSLSARKRAFFSFVPLISIGIGCICIGVAVWPVLQYAFFPDVELTQTALLTPVPDKDVLVAGPQVIVHSPSTQSVVLGAQTSPSPKPYEPPTILNEALDYTNLANWFPALDSARLQSVADVEYVLDIPKVKIAQAKVKVGGEGLEKNLIHFPGTALPGEVGNPVIFGHSILRQFYNPSEKNPNRYLSIFSTIMTLSKGDELFVTVDGKRLTYQVVEKRVVYPDDAFILAQTDTRKQIKLVTCVPEGTTRQRGVVVAELVSTQADTGGTGP